MNESQFEDILSKYPELIEKELVFKGRQISVKRKRVDLLFEDRHQQTLIVELKKGPIKREHIAQLMDYEGHFLSPDDPNVRVMLIGNRVPTNLRRSLDHHGFEWKEISVKQLIEFLEDRKDTELLAYFPQEHFKSKKQHKTSAKKSTKLRDNESTQKLDTGWIIGKVRGLSQYYSDGSERLEIWAQKSKAKGVPFIEGQRVEIDFIVGKNKYKAGLRSTEEFEHIWISPDLCNFNNEKVSLAHALTSNGFSKNEAVILDFVGNVATLRNFPQSDQTAKGRENFNKLLRFKKWEDECTKLTIHRQVQLAKIFDLYGGGKIPFSHFTSEITKNPSLRNSHAYPAVCAYFCGILKIEGDFLVKPKGIVWGEKLLTSQDTFWL